MKENTEISERVKQMIDSLNLNSNEFAAKLGYSRGQTVYDITKGKSKPSFDFLNRFQNSEYSVIISIEWLLTGKGEMLKQKPQTREQTENINMIPLYDTLAAAGSFHITELSPVSEPAEMINAGDWFRDATAAMRVHGDSMHPAYPSGSIVAMREVRNKHLVVYGEDYVIETSEYRVIKRLQRSEHRGCWLACSVNGEVWQSGLMAGRLIHEPFEINQEDVTRLHIVLGSVRRTHSSRIVYNHAHH